MAVPNSALNAVTAPDAYTPAATLDGGHFIHHFNLDVVNQAIFWQMKQTGRIGENPQMATWQAEVQMLPGSRTVLRPNMTGVRFRAVTPAASIPAGSHQAIVTVEVVS